MHPEDNEFDVDNFFVFLVNEHWFYSGVKRLRPFTVSNISNSFKWLLSGHMNVCGDIRNANDCDKLILARMTYDHYKEELAEFDVGLYFDEMTSNNYIRSLALQRYNLDELSEGEILNDLNDYVKCSGELSRIDGTFSRSAKELAKRLYSYWHHDFKQMKEECVELEEKYSDLTVANVATVNNEKYSIYSDNPCCEIRLDDAYMQRIKDEIVAHINNADNHFKKVDKALKECKMSNVPFETINYVYGKDIKDMSEQDFLNAIKKIEDRIKSLREVQVKSKKIAASIAELEGQLAQIVEAYDSAE